VPIVAAFAVIVNVLTLHWSIFAGPALAIVGGASFLSVMSSKVVGQPPPLLTVHLTIANVPAATPVIVVVGDVAFVMVAVPLWTVQIPVPIAGAVAAITKVVVLH
jgi:hypothetical protein